VRANVEDRDDWSGSSGPHCAVGGGERRKDMDDRLNVRRFMQQTEAL
jgi:hypothetical protein